MVSSLKNERDLFNHIYNEFLRICKNFYFTSKNLGKDLGLNPRSIGKSAMQLVKHDLLIKSNPGSDNTYLTKFNKNILEKRKW